MKKKSLYLAWVMLLFLSMVYQTDSFFAAEVSTLETNKNVGFYGEIDHEGDPKPQPPSEEQAQPSDKEEPPKLGGQLPKLNQIIKNYSLWGLLIFLFAIQRWKRSRNIRKSSVKNWMLYKNR